MSRMEYQHKNDSRREEILKAANGFFMKQGYTKTSMRQIAQEANVSLGLVSYHFNGKREMAMEVLQIVFGKIKKVAQMYVDQNKDPFLYSALLVRLNYNVFSSPRYLQFYKDVLRDDIFFDVITKSGIDTYMNIWKVYCPDMDEEQAKQMGWYGNYISVSMERTLVLYGGEHTIIPEPIPDIVFKSYMGMWHFEGSEMMIEVSCRESEEILQRIRGEHGELFV